MKRTLSITDNLYEYYRKVGFREADILVRLRKETAQLENAAMQIAPEQGQFMASLVQALGARRCLEVGTFTGYSALAVAMVLPDDGRLVACDISESYTSVGRRYWNEAGVAHKIDLRIAPAIETLVQLVKEAGPGTFDFAFIDADKSNYDAYYEHALQLVRPNGLILVDNVLWGGSVADETNQNDSTKAIRALNAKIHADARVDVCMVPIGDGVTMVRKR